MPLQLAGFGIQRNDGIGIKVIALTLVTVEIRTRISDWPHQSICFPIVSAGKPSGAAAMLECASHPSAGFGIARRRDGPEPPGTFARRSAKRVELAADAFVTARHARDYQIANYQRRGGGTVVLMRIRHLDIPQQSTVQTVERQHMRIVGDDKNAVAQHGNSTIDASGSIAG